MRDLHSGFLYLQNPEENLVVVCKINFTPCIILKENTQVKMICKLGSLRKKYPDGNIVA